MTELAPHVQVANLFMERKGYPDIRPVEMEKLYGQPCWYFVYELPEGVLELEVSWDKGRGEWDTLVTTFMLAK